MELKNKARACFELELEYSAQPYLQVAKVFIVAIGSH